MIDKANQYPITWENDLPKKEPIAIIGIGCRFPGEVRTPQDFWTLLMAGFDAITEVPGDRFDINAFFNSNPEVPGKIVTRFGGFISSVDLFDAPFFGVSPWEAARLDPQHRLLLEVTWEALEDAGQTLEMMPSHKAGVYLGIYSNDYEIRMFNETSGVDLYSATGGAHYSAAGRLSYMFDLSGPSMVVETACSSSLVAIHLACQSLWNGESDLAIAGGVNLILNPQHSIAYSKGRMLSPEGRCKFGDSRANGFARAEGCGIVILKSYSRALADGDQIYALVLGSAINNDGREGHFLAPSVKGQVAVLEEAYRNAGVGPNQVHYVEAHGTGTIVGDPIEIMALDQVIGKNRSKGNACLIGSVKTNIGHAETASGVAGLIKAALCLKNRTIPASLHFENPNPKVPWDDISLKIAKGTMPLPTNGVPGLIGVNSFGLTGMNAHIVLSEAPSGKVRNDGQVIEHRLPAPQVLLPLSARSRNSLSKLVGDWLAFLRADHEPKASLNDICFSASSRRTHHDYRMAVAGESRDEIAGRLEVLLKKGAASHAPDDTKPGDASKETVFVYSGQGPQWFAMGRQLIEQEPVFRNVIEECANILRNYADWDLLAELTSGEMQSRLQQTEYAQPAIFALQMGLTALLRSWGIEPQAVVGHSVGEVAAACTAGVLSLEEAVRIVFHRGRLLQQITGFGKMAAVGLSVDDALKLIEPYGEALCIAAVNSPKNVTLSGEEAPLQAILKKIDQQHTFQRMLAVNYAFHSPMVARCALEMISAVEGLKPKPSIIPIVSTVSGHLAANDDFGPQYWGKNIREPVQFASAIKWLISNNFNNFIEISAHPVLTLSIAQNKTAESAEGKVFHTLQRNQNDRRCLLELIGELYVQGYKINWPSIYPKSACYVKLPPYPWNRSRHWIEEVDYEKQQKTKPVGKITGGPVIQRTLLGRRLESPLPIFENILSDDFLNNNFCFKSEENVIFPFSLGVEMVMAAATKLSRNYEFQLRGVEYSSEIIFLKNEELDIQLILNSNNEGFEFKLFSRNTVRLTDSDSKWMLHMTGEVVPEVPIANPSLRSPGPTTLEVIQSRCREKDMASLRPIMEGRLPHTPALKVVQAWVGDGEALMMISARQTHEQQEGINSTASSKACAIELSAVTFALMQEERKRNDRWIARGARLYEGNGNLPGQVWAHVVFNNNADPLEKSANVKIDVSLIDLEGGLLAKADGLHLNAVPIERWRRSSLSSRGKRFYKVAWRHHDHPAAPPETQSSDPGNWLIFNDRDGIGDRLMGRLQSAGHSCYSVQPGDCFESFDNGRFKIDPTSSTDFKRLVQTIATATNNRLNGAVHLWSLSPNTQDPDMGLIDEEVLRNCGSALLLQKCLSTHATLNARIWLVTRGAQPVGDKPTSIAVAQAPLWGFGRVVALESPDSLAGLVDLDPDMDMDNSAQRLYEEIAHADGEDQVAVRGPHRYVARLINQRPPQAKAETFRLSSKGAYLITGGLGRLGLKLAQWMAEQGAGHLVLLGRKGLACDSNDAAPRHDDLDRSRILAVEAIKTTGAKVHIVSADVGNSQHMASLFKRFGQEFPPLRGIVHAAGVISPKPLGELAVDDFSSAFEAKVRGTWILHELIQHANLDFLVLFSSASSILGSKDLAHYATANHFLDAYAHYGRLRGQPVFSINWGWWAGGWKDDQLTKHLSQAGLHSISDEDGMAALREFIATETVQGMYADIDWRMLAPIYEAKKVRPFLDEIRSVAIKSIPSEIAASYSLAEELRNALPDARFKVLRDFIREEAAQLLGFQNPSDLDVKLGFFQMGMDSIKAVQLKSHVEEATGLELPATVAFEYPTISDLAKYVAGSFFNELSPSSAAEAGNPLINAGTESVRLTEQETLSEDELIDLISERLKKVQ